MSVCGVWAQKAGDLVSKFPGTNQGLTDAIAYCGSNGVVHIYPGGGSLTIPVAPSGVELVVHEAGVTRTYGGRRAFNRVGKMSEPFSAYAFGAVGDGVVDDTAALQAWHDALPTNGGYLFLPPGQYLISATLNFTKRVIIFGSGSKDDHMATSTCAIVKKSSLNGTGIILSGRFSVLRNLDVIGQAGNGGDGIQMKSRSITLEYVSVMQCGGNGIRIGHSDSTNCNIWYLNHVACRANSGDGLYIHSDDASVTMNANDRLQSQLEPR